MRHTAYLRYGYVGKGKEREGEGRGKGTYPVSTPTWQPLETPNATVTTSRTKSIVFTYHSKTLKALGLSMHPFGGWFSCPFPLPFPTIARISSTHRVRPKHKGRERKGREGKGRKRKGNYAHGGSSNLQRRGANQAVKPPVSIWRYFTIAHVQAIVEDSLMIVQILIATTRTNRVTRTIIRIGTRGSLRVRCVRGAVFQSFPRKQRQRLIHGAIGQSANCRP